jgi:hypothetical protein
MTLAMWRVVPLNAHPLLKLASQFIDYKWPSLFL